MSVVTVWTQQRDYEVHIGDGLLGQIGELTAQTVAACKVVLVSDSTVAEIYGDQVALSLTQAGFEVHQFVFRSGENSKNTDTLIRLVNYMARYDLTRTDLVVAMGGGVVGDVAGFAAAVYLRGIPFIQVPTTLLSAVDASVGGKTAVDLAAGKNLMGAFWQPSAVFCDCGTFRSLPDGEVANGMAEVVKSAMLRDEELFSDICEQGLRVDMEACVTRCVQVKSDIVSKDELDRGERQLLNFGHTVGHAIEKLSSLSVSHGHGVAIGMSVITKAAEACGLTAEPCHAALLSALRRCELPTACPYTAAELAAAALRDKKRAGGSITLVLPVRVGECRRYPLPMGELEAFLQKGL